MTSFKAFLEMALHPNPADNLKLWFTKSVLNLTVRLCSRFVPKRGVGVPTKSNARILAGMHLNLHNLAEAENALITERKNKRQDRNFLRLIDTVFGVLRYLAETDPYYDLWLGYALKEAAEQREAEFKRYAEQLSNIQVHGLEQLTDVAFQRCTFDAKTCGGLLLLKQKIAESKEDKLCLTVPQAMYAC